MPKPTAHQLDALLPQTQCEQCGFAGCLPYAQALAEGNSAINRCPPGGLPVMRALAHALEVAEHPLDESCGVSCAPTVVVIEEAHCIGCTKCIQACPVGAIAGARQKMHTVITHSCTGCNLCIAPCPVDCIRIIPATPATEECVTQIGLSPWMQQRAHQARIYYNQRKRRLANKIRLSDTQVASHIPLAHIPTDHDLQTTLARIRGKI